MSSFGFGWHFKDFLKFTEIFRKFSVDVMFNSNLLIDTLSDNPFKVNPLFKF